MQLPKYSQIWPNVSDRVSAKRAMCKGRDAAGFAGIAIALAAYFEVDGHSMESLREAALYSALAIGIAQRSRIAAVAALLLFAATQVPAAVKSAMPERIVLTSLLAVVLVNGARGAFAWHRLDGDPESNA